MQTVPRSLDELSYRRLVEATHGITIALIQLDGRIAYVNPACRWLVGYEPEELIGHPCDEFIPHGLARDAIATFRRARRGRPHLRQRTLVERKDGKHVYVGFDLTPLLDDEGLVEGVVVTAHEIDDEAPVLPAEDSGEAGERRESTMIEQLPAVIYAAEPGARGRWRYVSPQIEQLLGYSPEEWLAEPELWARRVHPDDRERVMREEEEENHVQGSHGAIEYRMVTRAGAIIWVRDEAVLRFDEDGTRRYDGLLIDITDRKRFESQLQFFADHDSLTGLLNRRRFIAELDIELKRKRRHGQPASVLMLDLDNLKQVNDSLGHRFGDALLRATADVLTQRLRESDTVARLGGDEFAVLLRGTDRTRAELVAEELVDAIGPRAGSLLPGVPGTGVSVGVAELRPEFRNPDDVLAAADRAMYEAKRTGGGRVGSQ